MAELERTRLVQVAPVRAEKGSAVLAATAALRAAEIDVGDLLAYAQRADPALVVATRVPGSVAIDPPTRSVRRQQSVVVPPACCEHLGLGRASEVEEGEELGSVAVYAADDSGTIALGTDAGPAVEPVDVG